MYNTQGYEKRQTRSQDISTENGYEMSQEGQENYDANVQAVKDAAKESDISETKYLQTVTGVSITMEEYEEILWKDALGKDYYENTQAKEYTAEDLEAYYEKVHTDATDASLGK